jgi:hypothetical protein
LRFGRGSVGRKSLLSIHFANLLFSFLVLFYLLPAGLALFRKHPALVRIAAVNLLLGWTFIGWGVALVWALVLPAELRARGRARSAAPLRL